LDDTTDNAAVLNKAEVEFNHVSSSLRLRECLINRTLFSPFKDIINRRESASWQSLIVALLLSSAFLKLFYSEIVTFPSQSSAVKLDVSFLIITCLSCLHASGKMFFI
jgi:hypothetical protein